MSGFRSVEWPWLPADPLGTSNPEGIDSPREPLHGTLAP